jgi:hypothetical protein
MAQFYGLYRALVIATDDPLGQRRLKVKVPAVLGDVAVWALACIPAGSRAAPRAGTTVWIQFEGGDPASPVWLGVLPQ